MTEALHARGVQAKTKIVWDGNSGLSRYHEYVQQTIVIVSVLVLGGLLSSCTHYDVETADTPDNHKGFESHFGFAPDNTVINVYYYADELGADVRYQLSFQCPKATVDKIITELSLKSVLPDQAESLLDPRDDLPWWKPDSIDNRDLWIKEKENEYYWQLWYSEKDGKAFYLEYSL